MKRHRILAWVLLVTVLSLTVMAVFGSLSAQTDGSVIPGDAIWVLLPLISAGCGMLILSQRPKNTIGWLLMTSALGTALILLAEIPGGEAPSRVDLWLYLTLWFQNWSWLLVIFPIFVLLQVFPTGRILSPRWRWLVVLEGLLAASSIFLAAFAKRLTPTAGDWSIANPVGFIPVEFSEGGLMAFGGFEVVFGLMLLIVMLGSVTVAVVRYRRARGDDRQQVKWLAYAVVIFAVIYPLGLRMSGSFYDLLLGLSMAGIPLAVAVAVLRYRLYDIDLVINRTVLFLLLAAFITAVYSGIVVGLTTLGTQGELGPAIAATAVIALAFEPFRLRAQLWADKVAYGKRATPYEVLSDLTQRLASTESTRGVFDRTAQRLADGTGAERAGVWVAAEGGFLLAGQWPQDAWTAAVSQLQDLPGTVVEIEAGGERLGALTVEKRRGDSVTPTETRLIQDLAGSSAPLLQNLGLQAELEAGAEELTASRRRLVEVQGLERRRLERALDEGAQQLVVSLKVKLNVAARLARTENAEQLAAMLDGMDQDARGAIAQIRSLARGLYPQLLEAEGLAAAVRSIADFGSVPVEVEAGGIGRFPAELEATAFFCISEAITNAAKHAPGRLVKVKLDMSDGNLLFSVRDEGPGFDRNTVELGSGLRNMADRLDATGGHLQITSSPGQGTTVHGTIPVEQRVRV
ncbi:MAG: ATP-binding protein [Acidimicrobiia bacterium]